ncbi:MAG TPA: class I SAM-dependent methyltransferase [Candidatus Woesebacteria bacterium]|nr:class I SAM-dependent methyltransferase [Candidatus Woesebacteria bacterium]
MGTKKIIKTSQDDTFWRTYATVYDLLRYVPIYRQMINDVEKAVEIKNTNSVLDVGCGTGNFIAHMINQNSKAEFIGIDIADTMLQRAQHKVSSANVILRQENLNNPLPFPNNYFDRIIAINSLYAVRDPNVTVSELWRVLKRGGTMVVVNPEVNTKFFEAYFGILNSGRGLQKFLLFFLTLPLFFFNVIIKMKANKLDYHFLPSFEWKKLFEKHKINSVQIKDTYVQSYLIKIVK